MKTKLLRKIRKEFEIYYNPKGILIYDEGVAEHSKYKFRVSTNSLFDTWYFKTKNECLDYIMWRVKRKYGHLKNKKLKQDTKVWYNK